MLKFAIYTTLISVALVAFFLLGSSIAMPLIGVLMVFMILIHYLKSRIVLFEEHDYRNKEIALKKQTPTIKSKKSIPADPKVLAAFHRVIKAKQTNSSKQSPILISNENEKPFQPVFSPAIEKESAPTGEKVFVSISNKAKEKYLDNSATKAKASKLEVMPQESNSRLDDNYPVKLVENSVDVKPELKKVKSIFDDLTDNELLPTSNVKQQVFSKNMALISELPNSEDNIDLLSVSESKLKLPKIIDVEIDDRSKLSKDDFDTTLKSISENPELARVKLIEHFSNLQNFKDGNLTEDLEKVCEVYHKEGQQKYALAFFITLLSEKRQVKDFAAMDEIYYDISSAYKNLEQADKLIDAYQNHLAIKETLNDLHGQLSILDSLGKLYFDFGNKDGTNMCYQRSLEVRKKLLSK